MNPAAFAPFNLGEILRNVEGIKSARLDRQMRQQQMADQEEERRAMSEVFATGQPDRTKLGAIFQRNPAAGLQVMKYLDGLDESSRKREGDKWKAAAPILTQLGQVPYESRRNVLQAASPVLIANGWTPDEIASFDPTDINVHSLSTAAMTINDVIQQNTVKWNPIGENGSFATDQYGNPVGQGNPFAQPQVAQGQPGNMQSYSDPGYDKIESALEQEYGLPQGLMSRIRTRGERSNADQVSPAGARSVYQIIPETRLRFAQKYGVDAYKSPENAARVAALHLRDSIARGEDPVRGYIGGPDKRNWGPQTQAYAGRVNGARKVSSKAEYDALPAGTQYIAPDGSTRTKR